MLEAGSFHLLAEKADSSACFSAAVQLFPNFTVGVAVAWGGQAVCPRSRREAFCQPPWSPVSHPEACIFLGHNRHKAAKM